MYKFKLIRGKHATKEKVYKKGDVIKTEKDLIALFDPHGYKFELLEGPEEAKPAKKAKKSITKKKLDLDLNDDEEKEEDEDQEAEDEEEEEEADSEETEDEESEEETTPVKSLLGVDVTDRFETAKDAELKVFKKGKDYFVADPENLKKALNKKPLNKNKVESFVKEHLG